MDNLETLARFGRQDAGRKTNKINKHDTTQKNEPPKAGGEPRCSLRGAILATYKTPAALLIYYSQVR